MENCMLILQSWRNSPEFLVGLCIEKSATLLMCMRVKIKVEATDMGIKEGEMSVTKVEEDTFINIKEEETSFVKIEEEMLVDVKENLTDDVNFPTGKAEQDQVSYISVCLLLDTFYEYPILCTIIYCGDLCLSVNKTTTLY